MASRIQDFVAGDGWLFVAIVTFGLISLAGLAGLEGLAGALAIVGWFVLTPILMFWGEEVAAIVFEDEEGDEARPDDADPDPLDELKRRYAAGEIDDEEFERRLERLVAVDEIPADAVGSRSTGGQGATLDRDDASRPAGGERSRERDVDRER